MAKKRNKGNAKESCINYRKDSCAQHMIDEKQCKSGYGTIYLPTRGNKGVNRSICNNYKLGGLELKT